MLHDIAAWDRAVTLWINQHHTPLLDVIFRALSLFGDGGWGWIVVILFLLIFGGRKERIASACLAAGLLTTEFLLMPYAREIWPRPRPFTYMEGIRTIGHEWDRPSFPSAHMHLWAQVTIVYGLLWRKWLWPLLILTLLTGYSRPYAGMHHVIDVFAGTALGAIVGVIELYAARYFLGPEPTTGKERPVAEEDDSASTSDE